MLQICSISKLFKCFILISINLICWFDVVYKNYGSVEVIVAGALFIIIIFLINIFNIKNRTSNNLNEKTLLHLIQSINKDKYLCYEKNIRRNKKA